MVYVLLVNVKVEKNIKFYVISRRYASESVSKRKKQKKVS